MQPTKSERRKLLSSQYHRVKGNVAQINWSYDVWRMSSYNLLSNTKKPILQPTETALAYKINLRQIIGVGCKMTRHPDRVKAPRGYDDRRMVHMVLKIRIKFLKDKSIRCQDLNCYPLDHGDPQNCDTNV